MEKQHSKGNNIKKNLKQSNHSDQFIKNCEQLVKTNRPKNSPLRSSKSNQQKSLNQQKLMIQAMAKPKPPVDLEENQKLDSNLLERLAKALEDLHNLES